MADILDIAERLTDCRDLCRMVHGEKWEGIAEKYQAVIRGVMGRDSCSMLSAATTLAKELDAAGHSPVALLGAACEMVIEEGVFP